MLDNVNDDKHNETATIVLLYSVLISRNIKFLNLQNHSDLQFGFYENNFIDSKYVHENEFCVHIYRSFYTIPDCVLKRLLQFPLINGTHYFLKLNSMFTVEFLIAYLVIGYLL